MPNSPITIRLRHNPGFTAWSHGWAFCPHSLKTAIICDGRSPPESRSSPRFHPLVGEIGHDPCRHPRQEDWRGGSRVHPQPRFSWMFRADEDFTEFWGLCRGHAVLRHCKLNRTGALLRCPTVFEDVVKTICTINAHWRNTKRMVENLCRMFGEACPGDGEAFTFPGPDRLAAASVARLAGGEAGLSCPVCRRLRSTGGGRRPGSRRLVPWSRIPMPCVQRSSASRGSATTRRIIC